jgi:DNA mismatch repair ATPase MutS
MRSAHRKVGEVGASKGPVERKVTRIVTPGTLTDAGLLELKNAERYITPELKSFEDNALSANERADALRYATANRRCPTAFVAGRTLISMS